MESDESTGEKKNSNWQTDVQLGDHNIRQSWVHVPKKGYLALREN